MKLQGLDMRIGMNWIWLKWLIRLTLEDLCDRFMDFVKFCKINIVTNVTKKSYKTHIPFKNANKNSEGRCV